MSLKVAAVLSLIETLDEDEARAVCFAAKKRKKDIIRTKRITRTLDYFQYLYEKANDDVKEHVKLLLALDTETDYLYGWSNNYSIYTRPKHDMFHIWTADHENNLPTIVTIATHVYEEHLERTNFLIPKGLFAVIQLMFKFPPLF